MKVIKRDGRIEEYNKKKIKDAITKANLDTEEKYRIPTEELLEEIVDDIVEDLTSGLYGGASHPINKDWTIEIEEIQDTVELCLQKRGYFILAKNYIKYRYKRELERQAREQDKEVLELLEGTNEYWNTENSNKNPKRANVQRDYMAGIESKRITENFLLPKDVLDAHKKGIIHFHDIDYFAQNAIHNCELINLKDMLDNGTVMNDIKIDPQHRLSTACTVATQIITAVSSNSYGGATITLSHLAPYVRMSKNEIKEQLKEELKLANIDLSPSYFEEIVNKRLVKEIKDSVQTFNYQINSMTNTNGQAPFLTVFMYISEDKEYEKETSMLIEEFLKQRILGMKNEQGVYITPAFPKLIYCLDENNIHEDSEYYYLTELAAKCSAKRLVPDYISAKVMKELKGDIYPSMGCRSFLTPDPINHKYYGRLTID